MGVGFFLTGTYGTAEISDTPEEWLEKVAAWIESKEDEPLVACYPGLNEQEQPCLALVAHPCAEEVELSVPGKGLCQVEAKTSTVGPGYHVLLCDMLKSMGEELGILWNAPDEQEGTGDETGYFHGGSVEQVRQEMTRWLGAFANEVLRQKEGTETTLLVAMPMGHRFDYPAPILTPMGPRDWEWFAKVKQDPTQGIDFFPWWEEGATARFFLGRALAWMWQDVRWRPPQNEEEEALLSEVHAALERSHQLDPALELPWREWIEVIGHLKQTRGFAGWEDGKNEARIRQRAMAVGAKPMVGYRRWPVTVSLSGGWTVEVPGEFAEEWDEAGENWSAGSGERNVWFSSLSYEGTDQVGALSPDETLAELNLPEGERSFEFTSDNQAGKAVLLQHEEEEGAVWQLRGVTAAPAGLGVTNIFFKDEEDLEWAVNTWQSLENEEH